MRLSAIAISCVLAVMAGLAGAASANASGDVPVATPTAIGDPPGFTSPTPSSSPSASPSVSPSPTVSPSPSVSPTPSPTPTPPIVCGFCFNPSLHSLAKASSQWVVVNKIRPLSPVAYKPILSSKINLAVIAATAYDQMKAGMKKAGAGTLILNSGYRSYQTQVIVHANQVSRLGLKAGEALAARPGHSEHQTGLAADVSASGQGCAIQVCFAKTKRANGWPPTPGNTVLCCATQMAKPRSPATSLSLGTLDM
ncbi:MAG: hypothetical protein RL096_615 [Actinomycetota bacterium]